MKKIIYVLLMSMMVLGLSACGKNVTGDLQSKKWNVVATNGEAYTAEFSKDKASFKMGFFNLGLSYEIDDNKITLEEEGKDPYVFEIEKDGNEYNFKAIADDVKEKFGDLTLSPSKE